MYQDKVTLCGSNAYEKKYYLNPDFSGLPEQIKQELQIACVLFTAEVGGVLTLEFDEEGKLNFVTHVEDNDSFTMRSEVTDDQETKTGKTGFLGVLGTIL